jgi:pimeloyl-ACP methyl ester carboxylesterase
MRVLAPDLRGFGRSDRPEGIEDYAIARSFADMVALLDGLDIERAHVVGHDWGAGLAWTLAALAPQRIERLVVMSVGHPNVLRAPAIEQRQKFWFQLLFQFTSVAEALLMRDDWRLFREWLSGAGDLDRYIDDLSRPRALTAGLNWYRANSAPHLELERTRPFPAVAAPTLGLWSTGDNYVLEDSMMRSEDHVTGSWRYERIEGRQPLDATRPARAHQRTTARVYHPLAPRPSHNCVDDVDRNGSRNSSAIFRCNRKKSRKT